MVPFSLFSSVVLFIFYNTIKRKDGPGSSPGPSFVTIRIIPAKLEIILGASDRACIFGARDRIG